MAPEIRLMLIDGHALIHRAYHALPEDLSTSSGELTNAVFGFASMLLKAIETLKPTHIILTMDRPVPTFRHRDFAEYKATRPSTPPPLIAQIGRVREVADAMHIPIYELDGFEADDLLGTLSAQAEAVGVLTTIVTGDLDTLQLVSDVVHVLTARRGIADTTLYDLAAVRTRYGIEPNQLPDYKGLVGDTSDNIPGVPSIGPKTATKLLSQYESLEGIFEHLEELPARWRESLGAGKNQVFNSRYLATIVRDAPVRLDLQGAACADLERARVINLFRELEFRTLIERLQVLMPREPAPVAAASPMGLQQLTMFGEAAPTMGSSETNGASQAVASGQLVFPDTLPGPEVQTQSEIVRTIEDLERLVAALRQAETFSMDTETTSTDPLRAKLVGLSFAVVTDRAWYVPVGHAEGVQAPLPDVLAMLSPLLEDASLKKIGHNLKYDYNVLSRYDVNVQGVDFDTMIAAYLVNSGGRSLSLSALALSRFGIEMTPIESLIGKGKNQITMDLVDLERVGLYAGADADVTLRLRDVLKVELKALEVEELFRTVEMPLIPVLADMEAVGISLDTGVLAEMSGEMSESIGSLEERIFAIAGRRFNINSTQQLGQVLFGQLKLRSGRRTKTGFSTDNEVLEGLRGDHEIVDSILDYRQLLKLKNTYVDALPSLINPETGKIHTDFNQTVAATGRLSSSNPNLQNIPIRGDIGRRIRRAFIASGPEDVLLAADYSQIELRILAAMSGDPRLVEAFETNEDIHRATAAAIFEAALEDVTSDQRRIAKVVNFGIIYGIGEGRLAHETGITRAEAKEFIANYNETYAGVKAFMDNTRKRAAMYGYVTTMLGRRRSFPEIHSENPGIRTAAERAAINMPIQGTAADIIKLAMIQLHAELRERVPEAKMVLQVHDELVFDIPRKDLEAVAPLVKRTMEQAYPLSVPLEVEMKFGDDWYDMQPFE